MFLFTFFAVAPPQPPESTSDPPQPSTGTAGTAGAAAGGEGGGPAGLSQRALLAAVVVPLVSAATLLAVGAAVYWRLCRSSARQLSESSRKSDVPWQINLHGGASLSHSKGIHVIRSVLLSVVQGSTACSTSGTEPSPAVNPGGAFNSSTVLKDDARDLVKPERARDAIAGADATAGDEVLLNVDLDLDAEISAVLGEIGAEAFITPDKAQRVGAHAMP